MLKSIKKFWKRADKYDKAIVYLGVLSLILVGISMANIKSAQQSLDESRELRERTEIIISEMEESYKDS